MIDFTKLTGIEHGGKVVTQIEDSAGRVLWTGSKPVVLLVEKITAETNLVGDTEYTNEQFILLDIYPTTNGTAKVTYGGLTKTITDTSGVEQPNAQSVYFGTYGGVSDNVETPASGELTIEGDCYAFACGVYNGGGKTEMNTLCKCVKSILSFGNTSVIAARAFGYLIGGGCPLETVVIPNTITEIRGEAFLGCSKLQIVTIGNRVSSIGEQAFNICSSLSTVKIHASEPPQLESAVGSDGTDVYYNFGAIGAESFVLNEIIVPRGRGNVYRTAVGWAYYADYIAEES